MEKKVWMVKIQGMVHPLRIEADRAFLDGYGLLVLSNECSACGPNGENWELVATFSKGVWTYCRCVGHISR
jgi:hypothetical protein